MRLQYLAGALALFSVLAFFPNVHADDDDDDNGSTCRYEADGKVGTPSENGTANFGISRNGKRVRIKLKNASPNSLYTVWIGVTDDSRPVDGDNNFLTQGVLPAFKTTQGATEGMGLDRNAILTDEDGDGKFSVKLDWDLLAPLATPLVSIELDTQDGQIVGGHWTREYDVDGRQVVAPDPKNPAVDIPVLVRGTANGFILVEHPYTKITHGHSPGTKNLDRISGFSAPFPESCTR